MDHDFYVHRCLELAAKGRGFVGSGALVGSVLVRDGKIIAEGFHKKFGEFHAERILLEKFDQEVRSTDVLYVNLEPCSHHGKTPPCTQILIDRGIKTVVYGMIDPDTRVAGKGIALLRSKGITVIGPVARAACERLNRGFVTVRTKARPWITLKHARTRDGRTANTDGTRLMITSEEQNIWSHTYLRSETDAILVGIDTVLIDNPKLDTRLAHSNQQEKGINPYRILFDRSLKISEAANLLTDDRRTRTIIITSPENAESKKAQELLSRGVQIHGVPSDASGFDFDSLWKILLTPKGDYHGITSLLVEGGEKTWASFRKAGLIDEDITLVGA